MEVFYIASLTLIAATIGTITGFGTSTLMIPVLVIFFPLVEAIFWLRLFTGLAMFGKSPCFARVLIFGWSRSLVLLVL